MSAHTNFLSSHSDPDQVPNYVKLKHRDNKNVIVDNDCVNIEYLEESVCNEADSDDEKYNLLTTHTLVLRQQHDGDQDTEYFHCLQCNREYMTMDDFVIDHQNDENENVETKIENDLSEVEQQNYDQKEEVVECIYEDEEYEAEVKYEPVEENGPLVEFEADVKYEHVEENDPLEELEPVEEYQSVDEYMPADEDSTVAYDDQGYEIFDEDSNVMEIVEEEHSIGSVDEQQQIVEENREVANHSVNQITINANESTKMAIKETDNSNANRIDRYYCCECKQIFTDVQVAENHQCTSNIKKPDASIIILPIVGLYQAHNNPLRKEFCCPICPKTFSSQQAVNRHERLIHTPKTNDVIVCNICNTEFNSAKGLKLHEKMHNESKMRSIQNALPAGVELDLEKRKCFFCQICKKNFDHSLLKIHRSMHLKTKQYVCNICNRKFENQGSFDMHQQFHANMAADKTKRLTGSCDNGNAVEEVPKKPKSRSQNLANAKRVYPCQYCGHEFYRPHEKVMHERVHTGEKPHVCEVCGKRFRVPYSLTLHLRTHTDIRPYACTICNKRFKSHSVYAHHLNTHRAEKPYKCDSCDKAFRTSVQLSGHRKSHTKPFTCTVCNRPFSSLYSVTTHMKSHSRANKAQGANNLKHQCQYCGAVYARQFSLRCHLWEKHETEQLAAEDKRLQNNYDDDNDNDNDNDVYDDGYEEHNVEAQEAVDAADATDNDDNDGNEIITGDDDAIYIDDGDAAMLLITAAAEAAASEASRTASLKTYENKISDKNSLHKRSPTQAQNEEMLEEIVTGWLDK